MRIRVDFQNILGLGIVTMESSKEWTVPFESPSREAGRLYVLWLWSLAQAQNLYASHFGFLAQGAGLRLPDIPLSWHSLRCSKSHESPRGICHRPPSFQYTLKGFETLRKFTFLVGLAVFVWRDRGSPIQQLLDLLALQNLHLSQPKWFDPVNLAESTYDL